LFLWISNNPVAGAFIICILSCTAVVCLGSYTLLAIGTGYSFNRAYNNVGIALAIGTVSVFIGAYIGALIAFPIGRFLCRKRI
jgi:uncharacterized membrane protein YdjX (TVP38/TMEM64 family)